MLTYTIHVCVFHVSNVFVVKPNYEVYYKKRIKTYGKKNWKTFSAGRLKYNAQNINMHVCFYNLNESTAPGNTMVLLRLCMFQIYVLLYCVNII